MRKINAISDFCKASMKQEDNEPQEETIANYIILFQATQTAI